MRRLPAMVFGAGSVRTGTDADCCPILAVSVDDLDGFLGGFGDSEVAGRTPSESGDGHPSSWDGRHGVW